MNKKNVIVLFGGQSSEHSVSLVSATTIIKGINQDKYNIYPVGITQEGRWLYYDAAIEKIATDEWKESGKKALISPDASDQSLLIFEEDRMRKVKVHVIFPALHGLYGEDGTVQGLFELAKIPYVGCGVLSSAVSMDKFYTKIVVDTLGIRQAKFVGVFRRNLETIDGVIENVEKTFDYPVFIKPSNAGSSVGVSKAHDRKELIVGLKEAAKHDRKILVEEFIDGREVECAVLGNENIQSSGVGEILPAAEFYDFDAKYNNAESKTVLNADLPEEVSLRIRRYAARIFEALDGKGFARVDFFVEKNSGEVVFNEINTLPGFTSISMFPMLWAEKGLQLEELVDQLLELALE
ncbi:D-alanine--D-alanine ligase family protein [Vallitalea okinawensis]|uniref:D-alanine--D-alanine ligase family protein n=1 Tax=Vallitalea okinawensis TaxID=2078660 RepID=UPI000CFB5D45|nr:D-alanine--D-alanine ligase family protein [Vallitalea okinawensis]